MAFFRYNGAGFYYEVAGSGEPLLLINGLGCDSRTMAPLAGRLEDSFTVINYDMRCAGRSDKPDEHFTIAQVAEDIFNLIRHLGYRRMNALGFSMGGMAAMELFRSHRDIVDRLYLVSCAPSFDRPYQVSGKMRSILHSTEISDELLRTVYGSMFGSRFRSSHPPEEYIRFRREDANPQPLSAYLRQLEAAESFDGIDIPSSVDVPTFIVFGDEDMLIPSASFEWLHEKIAGSRVSRLKGVGHMVPVEAASELAEIIRASVRRA